MIINNGNGDIFKKIADDNEAFKIHEKWIFDNFGMSVGEFYHYLETLPDDEDDDWEEFEAENERKRKWFNGEHTDDEICGDDIDEEEDMREFEDEMIQRMLDNRMARGEDLTREEIYYIKGVYEERARIERQKEGFKEPFT